jgi:hypothetical protein
MPSNTFRFSGLLALISLKSCRHIYYVNQTNLSILGINLSLDLPRWHKRKYMRLLEKSSGSAGTNGMPAGKVFNWKNKIINAYLTENKCIEDNGILHEHLLVRSSR